MRGSGKRSRACPPRASSTPCAPCCRCPIRADPRDVATLLPCFQREELCADSASLESASSVKMGLWTLPDTGDVLPPPPWSVRSISPPSIAISAPATLHVAPLPPIPPQFLIGAVLLLVIVAVHLWVMIRINRSLGDPKRDRAFFESTLVRVLVPPQACDRAAVTLHRFALTVCFALLSIAAAWVVAVILPFLLPEWAGWLLPIAFAAWMAAGTVPFFRPDSLGWLVPSQRPRHGWE